MNDLPKPSPEYQLKPHLVWLGKFLGSDVYIDVEAFTEPEKHANFARRVFKAKLEEMN